MSVPLLHQIEELERELVFRRDVYPRQVARKKMRQGEADQHMARMTAALHTLMWLQRNEEKIRAAIGEQHEQAQATT